MALKHHSNPGVLDRIDEALDGANAIFRQKAIDEAVAAASDEAGLEQGDKAKAQVEGSDGSA